MLRSKKIWVLFAFVVAAFGGIFAYQSGEARADRQAGMLCVMDVLAGSEVFHREILLQEGETYFEDFSTRTRFKYFTATLEKVNGESTVSVNWFADISVFNSLDLNTSVTLQGGQKSGKSSGNQTLYTSNGRTTSSFTLTCEEN